MPGVEHYERREIRSCEDAFYRWLEISDCFASMIRSWHECNEPNAEELMYMIGSVLALGSEWIYYKSTCVATQRCRIRSIEFGWESINLVIEWTAGPDAQKTQRMSFVGNNGFIVPVREGHYWGMRFFPIGAPAPHIEHTDLCR